MPSLLIPFHYLAGWRKMILQALFVLGILMGVVRSETQAQTPPITSSGLNTQVSAPINLPGGAVQHNITGGTRPGGGANLFHSFGDFGVPTDNIANFLNDSGLPTSNILSRVTGGNPSNIFGTIKTENFGNANLFLMNPAGIVFGPNASLNVGGSTHFTTADYLRLRDGVQFTALPSAQDVLLSVAPVAAFGFLESNPAGISIEGSTLSVQEGQTISLVGGAITIGGGLKAPEGNISIASVASSGEAPITDSGRVELFDAQDQPLVPVLGEIVIAPGSQVDVSGNAAGTISIRGGKLTVRDSQVLAVTGDKPGAPVGIDIKVSGDANFLGGQLGQSYVMTWSEGSGNAGDVG
jgi:filamentous hemagglutinin family protein